MRAQLEAGDASAKASKAERLATCTGFHRPDDPAAAARVERLRDDCGRIVGALAHDLADGSRFECLVLVGPEAELRAFVDALTAVRGVRRARYAAHPLPRTGAGRRD